MEYSSRGWELVAPREFVRLNSPHRSRRTESGEIKHVPVRVHRERNLVQFMHGVRGQEWQLTGRLVSFKAYVLQMSDRQKLVLYQMETESGTECWLVQWRPNSTKFWWTGIPVPTHPTNYARNYLDDEDCEWTYAYEDENPHVMHLQLRVGRVKVTVLLEQVRSDNP